MPALGISEGISKEKENALYDTANVSNDDDDGTPQNFHCLITGANSGLGLSLCCRFLTHFLLTRPATHHLTLIFTTRSIEKSVQTTAHILETLWGKLPPPAAAYSARYTLVPALVDLTELQSVYALAARLRADYQRLDWVFLNAGVLTTAGGGGVNYIQGVKSFFTDPVKAVTTPDFKLQTCGEVILPRSGQRARVRGTLDAPPGTAAVGEGEEVEEDQGLGLIWCANVFGHYCLVRGVLGLLCRGGVRNGERARVVWTSSLDGHARCFDPADIQCVRGKELYESSKRLTDILALTWPTAASCVFSDAHDVDKESLPRFYLTHPAVCATNIAGQHPIIWYIMILAFYIVRVICGSPWHPITAWKGNAANMFVAEERESVLEGKGKLKWGSGCGRWGDERVRETRVEGVQEGKVDEEMEEVGRRCWVTMEELRRKWEGRLGLGGY